MKKEIEGFPAYRVSALGFIESRWRTGNFYNGYVLPDIWKRMKNNERQDGYHSVELRDGYGRKRKTFVHILIAEAFHGARPFPKAVVRHLDGDPSNNAAANLAWGTYTENEADKHRHGTWDSRYSGKLTDAHREAIRARASAGESQRALAHEFGVSRPTVTRLVNGATWKNK